MRRTTLFVALAVGLATGPAVAEDKLKVVASFSIIGDMAARIGDERIELSTLVGPDGDAHVFEPKPGDAQTVAKAKVMLVNGLNFEGWLERLIEASGSKATVVAVAAGVSTIPSKEAHGHEGEERHEGHAEGELAEPDDKEGDRHGDVDPHAWQSVTNAILYVDNVAKALCAADAAGCVHYKANAAAYTAELRSLDAEIRKAVAALPRHRRTVIASHDAFGYFESAYGITFLAPEGVSTESEASAADVARLIDQIKSDKASALFVENVSDPRLIEQIGKDTGLRAGGTLYSDALSGPDGPASTYIDMMRHNARTLTGALAARS